MVSNKEERVNYLKRFDGENDTVVANKIEEKEEEKKEGELQTLIEQECMEEESVNNETDMCEIYSHNSSENSDLFIIQENSFSSNEEVTDADNSFIYGEEMASDNSFAVVYAEDSDSSRESDSCSESELEEDSRTDERDWNGMTVFEVENWTPLM
jgi:hypothetical protein